MEKKQSSIDWYENKLIQLDIDFGGHKNYWVERKKLRDQAKAMHKEEVKESYREGRTDNSLQVIHSIIEMQNNTTTKHLEGEN